MPSKTSNTCDKGTQCSNTSAMGKKGGAAAYDKLGSDIDSNTRPANKPVCGNNVASSFAPTTDENGNYIGESSDSGTSVQRVNSGHVDESVRYTKDGYDRLMNLCQKMFGRLQMTAAFLGKLSTTLQGQVDPVSMALSDQIGTLNIEALLIDADETLAVAKRVDQPISVAAVDASVQSSLTIPGNLSLEAFVIAEAAAIKTKVAELQEKLGDVTDKLSDARSELSAKEEIIDQLKHQLASYVDASAGKAETAEKCVPSGDGDHGSHPSVNPGVIACECREFDDYLQALVKNALDLADDKTEVKPPKRIDPSVHESITTVITVAKKVHFHRVQRVFMKLREGNHDIARDVTEILERVVTSKFMSNDVVQGLKKVNPDPKKLTILLPDLLQAGRDVRDALIFAESQLKSIQEAVTINKHIPEIIHEIDDISQVLREVKNRRTAVSRRQSNERAMKFRKQSF
uniref:AIP3 domain-containing protein n=1 Tax=Panagrellus redivivus TaxID=6233 RepID=A0A7E4ZWV4_PANRE